MDKNYSLESMGRFLDLVGEKGLVKRNTALSWKTAVSRVLDDLTPTEKEDVRRVDVDTAFTKFENRNGGKYSPASLAQYRGRVLTAVREFLKWVESPASYKPRPSSRGADEEGNETGKARRRQPKSATRDGTAVPTPSTPAAASVAPVPTSGLSLAFPMRPDFLAQVVVPRDITADEARRLGAFVLTLAADFKPTLS